MIEMRMRQQDQIDVRQLRPQQRGRHHPFQPHRYRAHTDAAAIAEDGVGEYGESIQLEQHGAMAQPGRV